MALGPGVNILQFAGDNSPGDNQAKMKNWGVFDLIRKKIRKRMFFWKF